MCQWFWITKLQLKKCHKWQFLLLGMTYQSNPKQKCVALKHKTGSKLGEKWKQGWPDLISSYWGCKKTADHKKCDL